MRLFFFGVLFFVMGITHIGTSFLAAILMGITLGGPFLISLPLAALLTIIGLVMLRLSSI